MSIALPDLSATLEPITDLQAQLRSDETVSVVIAENTDITGITAKGAQVTDTRLIKILASQARLEKSNFTDVEITNCDLNAVYMPESAWRRVRIQSSRCSGLQLQSSSLRDVTFVDCKLDLANLRFTSLTNVCFKNCILDEADFNNAKLTNVTFQNCSLDKTSFSNTKLKRVDFRSSAIYGIVGIASLAGAIIDSAQLVAIAPLLAAERGITVRDD